MGRINIEIPDDVHRVAKAACALEDITLIEFINQAIAEKLKHDDKGEKK